MSTKRTTVPKEQEKLFEGNNKLEEERKEMELKIDKALKHIEVHKEEVKKAILDKLHTDEATQNE